MPRDFGHQPRPGYRASEGQVFEVQFVPGQRGGVMTAYRVNGRVAFPERRGQQPADGDIWQVSIAGENPAGSVYFLRCLKRVSTSAERRAAAEAQRNRAANLWQQRDALKPEIQSWLNAFSQWSDKEVSFEIQGVACVLRPKIERFSAQANGLVLTIVPMVEYLEEVVAFNSVEVTVLWKDLQVERVYVREPWSQVCADVTSPYGQHSTVFFASHAGEVRFTSWEHMESKLMAHVTMRLNGVETSVTVQVAEFKVQNGKGEVRLVSEYSRSLEERIQHYVPDIPEEHMEWLQGMKRQRENRGLQAQTLGLLTLSQNVASALRDEFTKLGYGGVGWSPWASDSKHIVIHPALRQLFAGLPVEFFPAEMRERAPQEAWSAITWYVGEEPPSQDQISQLVAETSQEEEAVELQRWLSEYGEDSRALPCTIVCEELAEPRANYDGVTDKYVFHAQVEAPYIVRTYRKNIFGVYGLAKPPVLSEQTVVKSNGYTFTNLAYGNEFFEGESTLELVRGKISRYERGWLVRWTAPETKAEQTDRKVEAIRRLIQYGREYQTVLSGWRYTDTGNPVVLVNFTGGWVIREFDRASYTIDKRKGLGSNRGVAYSLDHREILKALGVYEGFGWPVEQDSDWQATAGKNILSLFPEELIKKLEGGE